MHEFAVKGVEALAREKKSLGKDFEAKVLQYYDITSKYCLN